MLQMQGWRFHGHAISVYLPRGEQALAGSQPLPACSQPAPVQPGPEPPQPRWHLIFSGLPPRTSGQQIVQFFG